MCPGKDKDINIHEFKLTGKAVPMCTWMRSEWIVWIFNEAYVSRFCFSLLIDCETREWEREEIQNNWLTDGKRNSCLSFCFCKFIYSFIYLFLFFMYLLLVFVFFTWAFNLVSLFWFRCCETLVFIHKTCEEIWSFYSVNLLFSHLPYSMRFSEMISYYKKILKKLLFIIVLFICMMYFIHLLDKLQIRIGNKWKNTKKMIYLNNICQ